MVAIISPEHESQIILNPKLETSNKMNLGIRQWGLGQAQAHDEKRHDVMFLEPCTGLVEREKIWNASP